MLPSKTFPHQLRHLMKHNRMNKLALRKLLVPYGYNYQNRELNLLLDKGPGRAWDRMLISLGHILSCQPSILIGYVPPQTIQTGSLSEVAWTPPGPWPQPLKAALAGSRTGQLANGIGYSTITVGKWIYKSQLPNVDLLPKIATTLQINVYDLVPTEFQEKDTYPDGQPQRVGPVQTEVVGEIDSDNPSSRSARTALTEIFPDTIHFPEGEEPEDWGGG